MTTDPETGQFPIDLFMETLSESYEKWDAPAITIMARRGASPFEILVSTMLSLRTRDAVTLKAAERLLGRARTPEAMQRLGHERIQELIYPVTFYPTKALRLARMSRILTESFKGRVPERMDQLLSLPGVGRKTANLVLVEGHKKQGVCVDTHVHRISNRIGYVGTTTPEQTETALRKKLPGKYWKSYNEMLVAFGQAICRPISPFCSRCPVNRFCRKVGVNRRR